MAEILLPIDILKPLEMFLVEKPQLMWGKATVYVVVCKPIQVLSFSSSLTIWKLCFPKSNKVFKSFQFLICPDLSCLVLFSSYIAKNFDENQKFLSVTLFVCFSVIFISFNC